MSESAQAAEAATDGEQENESDEYADVEADIIEPHEEIGTYNAAKVAFARMLVESMSESEELDVEPEDVQWATGTANTLVDGERIGLAEEAVDRSRRPIWVVQVYNQLGRALCTEVEEGTDGPTEVTTETLDADAFQRFYDDHLDEFLDDANHLSVNGLNDGLEMRGFHPDSFLVEPPESERTSSRGPRTTVAISPSGTELDASMADEVNFDPKTGDELSDVEIRTEAELAEMSEDERSDYFHEDVEVDIPEAEESDSDDGGDEAEAEEADTDLESIVGVGEATAEDLRDAGFETVEEVEEASAEDLQEAGLNAGTVGNIKGAN